jgi:hypothetical protein
VDVLIPGDFPGFSASLPRPPLTVYDVHRELASPDGSSIGRWLWPVSHPGVSSGEGVRALQRALLYTTPLRRMGVQVHEVLDGGYAVMAS